jgi:hypothetical protein
MKSIIRLLLMVALMGPACADLLDPLFGVITVRGTVAYVQNNHFILVSKDNQYLRIFLRPGQMLPSGVVPGLVVTARISGDANDQSILESLEEILGPDGQPAPALTQPQS